MQDIFLLLILPMMCTGIVAVHIRPMFVKKFAQSAADLPSYTGVVLKCEKRVAVVQFRIESERKTIIQTVKVGRNYRRGDKMDIYFAENGMEVTAMPKDNSVYELGYSICSIAAPVCWGIALILWVFLIIL